MQYIEGFPLEAFVTDLLDGILSQPWRGSMLRALDDLFRAGRASSREGIALSGRVNFQRLLAAAVEAQGE